MPRHLISDAHEWINEIPTVPIYYLAKPQQRERALQNQRGKRLLLLRRKAWRREALFSQQRTSNLELGRTRGIRLFN